MNVPYFNILLFAVPLNILINTHKNPSITPCHTPKIPSTRLLCECELYVPVNYDSDPQMKSVMENFNKQTQQRIHEYDERMKTTRQKCKDKCDKVVQKIILKDKLEKQMTEQFATLDTDIQRDAIPTCVCEKTMADKTEKFCLNCGKTMGGFFPGYCLVSGLWYAAWTNYVPIAVAKAAMDAGMNVIKETLKTLGAEKLIPEILKGISSTGQYANITQFAGSIQTQFEASCRLSSTGAINPVGTYNICTNVINDPTGGSAAQKVVSKALELIVGKAPGTAEAAEKLAEAQYASTTSSLTTGITASILAIEIIVLIMVIIYMILRYRRKKKMKKKLQYIKLLEE
ncbi:rifin [Plasmodium reichenowi]|uniref:Rifin n=1 Tax=Plasmodium reichenowi TaxID=5854 RepID=A0A060RM35_PLARE|nr:rifin [Plasmodium reichenowi]